MFFFGGGEMGGGRPLPLGFHWQTLKIDGIFGGGSFISGGRHFRNSTVFYYNESGKHFLL